MWTLSPCTRVRTGTTTLAVLLLLAWPSSPLFGQATSVSATMLRVLAETADGVRTGRDVYFVADYRFPHHVTGPFATRAAADRVRSDSGATFGVFGPYRTAADPVSDSATRVVRVTVVTENARGTRQTIEIDPSVVDALFFTQSAVDKFVIPYYSELYGPQYATRLQGLTPFLYPKCHASSNICIPNPDGSIVPLPAWDTRWGPPQLGRLPGY